MNHRVLGDKIV